MPHQSKDHPLDANHVALKPGLLAGVRVIEVADELGEYCGLLLAGLGAEVIKIEPLEGSPTREIGPFVGDESNPEKSIFFGHITGARSRLFWILKPMKGKHYF